MTSFTPVVSGSRFSDVLFLQAEGREVKEVHCGNQQTMKALCDQEVSLRQMAANSDAARQELSQKLQIINDREVSPYPLHLHAYPTILFHRCNMLAMNEWEAVVPPVSGMNFLDKLLGGLHSVSPGPITADWMSCLLMLGTCSGPGVEADTDGHRLGGKGK